MKRRKNKKVKKILIAIVVTLMLVIGIAGSALAADPTTAVVTWNGGGVIGGMVTAGDDAVASFNVNAGVASGTFTVTDSNNNPYGYNVDSVVSNIVASVSNGWTEYIMTHTDQYAPMYGPSGQHTYSFIGASPDGSAQMAMWTSTNYAAMGEANYGHSWTPSSDTFTASAESFQIIHQVWDSDGETAYIDNSGSGTSHIDVMSSDLSSHSLTFGSGAGCYTDASFDGSGNQNVTFYSGGNNGVSQFGITTTGTTALQTILNFIGTASIPDFHAIVN